MFLSPFGTLGMKYWVCRGLLVRVVWLEGSLMQAEIPTENVGIGSWAARTCRANVRGRSAGGSRVCTSPVASPSEGGSGVGEVVMHKPS